MKVEIQVAPGRKSGMGAQTHLSSLLTWISRSSVRASTDKSTFSRQYPTHMTTGKWGLVRVITPVMAAVFGSARLRLERPTIQGRRSEIGISQTKSDKKQTPDESLWLQVAISRAVRLL